uniref:Uncharacterized protein n=1 Tax=Lotharella oceanica TaxID=641309 RepID=A0A7S2TNB2_9EUKA|mmetsp:Transcript_22103/g.41437  ORF Transcript_22103/g.41437 Transcript_22103/m.41437 type:complete len:290 (+) Transcript_22103:179-1048(+)
MHRPTRFTVAKTDDPSKKVQYYWTYQEDESPVPLMHFHGAVKHMLAKNSGWQVNPPNLRPGEKDQCSMYETFEAVAFAKEDASGKRSVLSFEELASKDNPEHISVCARSAAEISKCLPRDDVFEALQSKTEANIYLWTIFAGVTELIEMHNPWLGKLSFDTHLALARASYVALDMLGANTFDAHWLSKSWFKEDRSMFWDAVERAVIRTIGKNRWTELTTRFIKTKHTFYKSREEKEDAEKTAEFVDASKEYTYYACIILAIGSAIALVKFSGLRRRKGAGLLFSKGSI